MANNPSRKSKRRAPVVHDPATNAMILMEYARDPRPRDIARRFNLPNHMYVTRLWNKLSEEEKEAYRVKAQDIRDEVAERVSTRSFELVDGLADRMARLIQLSLDEYERRLQDENLRTEVSAKELTGFIHEAHNFVSNAAAKNNEEEQEEGDATQLFDMIDQVITENINSNENR